MIGCFGNWTDDTTSNLLFPLSLPSTGTRPCGTYSASTEDDGCAFGTGDDLTCTTQLCAGPCNGPYDVTTTKDIISVECSRYYLTKQPFLSCQTNMKSSWTKGFPAVNAFFDMERALAEEGRVGAERACEKACAATNACVAFGVSSDRHVDEGSWQCQIFYACALKQYNEHLDLYARLEPRGCFAKATTHTGVYVNFVETNGELAQNTRLLNVPIEPFYDVHVNVNGHLNGTSFSYRPYRPPRDAYCEGVADDTDCIFLHAGPYSALVISIFVLLLAYNSCILWVSTTKGTAKEVYSSRPLRAPTNTKLRKRKGSSEIYF